MMMSLGDFVFEIGSLPFQQLQRSTSWNFAQGERFGARKASQATGPGDDKITLTGGLIFGFAGSYSSIDKIRAMGDAQEAYTLTAGTGDVMGNWLIKAFNVNTSEFLIDGVARKADFTLELERTDD